MRCRCPAPRAGAATTLFRLLAVVSLGTGRGRAASQSLRSALRGGLPTDQVLRLDTDGDGRSDVLERWWNDKRVRWLDASRWRTLERDLTRSCYLGRFDDYVRHIEDVPAR